MIDRISQAADSLWEARRTGVGCVPIRTLIGDTDAESAYAVQEHNTKRQVADGLRLVGRKIGLTAESVQRQLGVSQPDYGMLFDDMDVSDGGAIPPGRLIAPRVEAEIAFIIGRDLTAERLTTADVLSAIEYAVPALEIVDSRVTDWDIRITDTIADNASSGLYVLGHQLRRLEAIDVKKCGMVMECDGEVVATGAGAACLGSPITATLWLARVMVKAGRPLRCGDVVLSGALGPMVSASARASFEARIEGLGSVRVRWDGPSPSRSS